MFYFFHYLLEKVSMISYFCVLPAILVTYYSWKV